MSPPFLPTFHAPGQRRGETSGRPKGPGLHQLDVVAIELAGDSGRPVIRGDVDLNAALLRIGLREACGNAHDALRRHHFRAVPLDHVLETWSRWLQAMPTSPRRSLQWNA